MTDILVSPALSRLYLGECAFVAVPVLYPGFKSPLDLEVKAIYEDKHEERTLS